MREGKQKSMMGEEEKEMPLPCPDILLKNTVLLVNGGQ